jgi:glycine betaine/proline transport system substrate-binding protein
MKTFLIIGCFIAASLLIAGCTDQGAAPQDGEDAVQEKLVLVSTPYDTELSSANVLKLVYEQAGYDMEIKIVDVGLAFQAVADGSVDCFVGAWLPTCHGNYLASYEDQMEFVRVNMQGTRCGLVVPAYVTIDSIEELNSVKDQFGGEIIGIEPGAGIMKGTEDAIETYDLEYDLLTGSEASMAASLKSAIDDDEWVMVTGWSPHWKFVRWDLKYLDDPENIYGGEEDIVTFTRQGFKEDMPEAYAILERFSWDASDMESIMLDMEDGMTEEEAAAVWVDAHPEKVAAWLGEA